MFVYAPPSDGVCGPARIVGPWDSEPRRRNDELRARLGGALGEWLPRGHLLLDQEWSRRHWWIVRLLWAHAAGLFCFALLQGYGLAHSLFEGSLVGIPAFVAGRETFGRKFRSGAASLGLVTSSAVLVHLWDGQIEGHFHFFFVVSLLTLYQDWFPFLLVLTYVVGHHTVLGVLYPASVYNHSAAIGHPWVWALIHGGFVLAASAASIVSWRVNERLLHEPLTGLAGQAMFLQRVQQALARDSRQNRLTAVLFLGLERFKALHDTLGRTAGDQLLIETAKRIKAVVRREDLVARLGSDEFAVLYQGVRSEDEALEVGERIRVALMRPLVLNGIDVAPGARVGIAINRGESRSAEELMADAALALGRAEPVQGTGCVVYGASMRRQDLERVEIESALRTAVERSELRVFYQPIVSIQNGEIEALEALVRWEHPERGLIAPGEFIPVAEQTGLIVGIGSWVLREACREAFISKLRDDREDEAIVSAIAGMARALDLRVVGEGVEHEGQLRSLRRLGFDSAQGYLFGRPGPARGIAASSPARLRKPLPPVELLGGEPALAAAGS